MPTAHRRPIGLALAACFFVLASRFGSEARAETSTLHQVVVHVHIEGISAKGGKLLVAIYNGPTWKEKPVSKSLVPVRGAAMTIEIRVPQPGRYAIRMFQDIDSDNKLDTDFLGIPSEPIGFSNGAIAQFGQPSFEAAAFEVSATGGSQTIRLR